MALFDLFKKKDVAIKKEKKSGGHGNHGETALALQGNENDLVEIIMKSCSDGKLVKRFPFNGENQNKLRIFTFSPQMRASSAF